MSSYKFKVIHATPMERSIYRQLRRGLGLPQTESFWITVGHVMATDRLLGTTRTTMTINEQATPDHDTKTPSETSQA